MSPGMTDLPEGAVIITTADIYRQLIDLTKEVGELKGAVQKATEISRSVEDHEARLRSLERGRWPLPSLAALISVASLVAALMALINGK